MGKLNPTQRLSVGLDRATVKSIDEIADGFEAFVSRGEVIDMAFDYILDDPARTIEAFGPEDEDEGGGEGEAEDDAPDEADASTEEDR